MTSSFPARLASTKNKGDQLNRGTVSEEIISVFLVHKFCKHSKKMQSTQYYENTPGVLLIDVDCH